MPVGSAVSGLLVGPIGWPELTILLVIVLVIFGTKRVPEIFGSLGKGIREFRKATSGEDEAEEEKPQAKARARRPTKKS